MRNLGIRPAGRDLTTGAAHGSAALTTAERQCVGLVAEGLADKEIARRLGVAPRTVGKHLTRAYRKLGVSNRYAAALSLGREREAAGRTPPAPALRALYDGMETSPMNKAARCPPSPKSISLTLRLSEQDHARLRAWAAPRNLTAEEAIVSMIDIARKIDHLD